MSITEIDNVIKDKEFTENVENAFKNTNKQKDIHILNIYTQQNAGYKEGDTIETKTKVDKFGRIMYYTVCVIAVVGSIVIIASAISSAPVTAPVAAAGGFLAALSSLFLLGGPTWWPLYHQIKKLSV